MINSLENDAAYPLSENDKPINLTKYLQLETV